MKKLKEGWNDIGVVGVDSGQLMVCDPGYIDGEWKSDAGLGFLTDMRFTDIETGKSIKRPADFEKIYKKGITYNQAIARGILKEIPIKRTGEFSYDGCGRATLSEGYGQLNFKMGHAGAGVVFSSGFGDGSYKVKVLVKNYGTKKHPDMRIAEARVVMIIDKEIKMVETLLKRSRK